MKKRITLDDLPKYSNWPERLLARHSARRLRKTPDGVTREFDSEKWGSLLKWLESQPAATGLAAVDRAALGDFGPQPCSVGEELILMDPLTALAEYRKWIHSTLAPLGRPAALAELGAGYGAILFWLSKRRPFNRVPLFAGEYAASGRELLRRIAKREKNSCIVGDANFYTREATDLEIPENAIIFTSLSSCYVPKLGLDYVRALARFRPHAVVHFEACLEHYDATSLLGMMRGTYLHANDYNTNLFSVLQHAESRKLCRILSVEKCGFGMNPLLPCSAIVWRPL